MGATSSRMEDERNKYILLCTLCRMEKREWLGISPLLQYRAVETVGVCVVVVVNQPPSWEAIPTQD
jgi:hypothetical protein